MLAKNQKKRRTCGTPTKTSEVTVSPDTVYDFFKRGERPEVLLEVHAWTGFADEPFHFSEANARVSDLVISLCAALMAEACNIGMEPLTCPDPSGTDAGSSWLGA
jgi:hypothetical protein